jgi:hypothetical protein
MSEAMSLLRTQKQEFATDLKVLGTTLIDEGWEAYKLLFKRLAFSNDWDDGLLDLDVEGNTWDVDAEDDEQAQDRKNIFLLLCSTTGKHKHLLNSIPMGDAQLAWRVLNDNFSGNTAVGSYSSRHVKQERAAAGR